MTIRSVAGKDDQAANMDWGILIFDFAQLLANHASASGGFAVEDCSDPGINLFNELRDHEKSLDGLVLPRTMSS